MKNSGLEVKGSFSVGDNPAEYDVTFEEREQALQKITEMQEKLHRKERHSPYERFAQTNLDGTDKLIALTQKNALAMQIYLFIADRMDGLNSLVCSYTFLAEYFQVSKSSVTRAVRVLREEKILYIMKSGSANVYILNPEIVWKSYGSNVRYCEFKSKVLLCESEQDKLNTFYQNAEAGD